MIKNCLILIFYTFGIFTLLRLIFPRKGVAIICFHQMPSDEFRAVLLEIIKHDNVISLDDFISWKKGEKSLPKNAVVLTSDDGYMSNYLDFFPTLRELGLPATIFLTSSFIGGKTKLWWDKVRSSIMMTERTSLEYKGKVYDISTESKRCKTTTEIEEDLKTCDEDLKTELISNIQESCKDVKKTSGDHELTMDWDQVREMSAALISFGAHSMTHPILTRISLEQARQEIVQSGIKISEEIGKPVNSFAYPNGKETDFNQEIIDIVRDSGYQCALSFVDGLNYIDTDVYMLRRINCHDFEPSLLEYKLSGFPYLIKAILSFILGKSSSGTCN